MQVNIVIPMAGEGSRFRQVGYHKPKPFIDVAGRPMVEWVFGNLDSPLISPRFIIIVRKEHDERWDLARKLRSIRPGLDVVYCDKLTDGAACTTLLARPLIDNDTPLLVANADQYMEVFSRCYVYSSPHFVFCSGTQPFFGHK